MRQTSRIFIFGFLGVVVAYGCGVLTPIIVGQINFARTANSSQSTSLDTNYLQSIIDIIGAQYLGDLPENSELTTGAAKGLVDSLGDKYTSYLSAEESKVYFSDANNEFEGIGVTLGKSEAFVVIETVLDGFPAQKAGIMNQDIITEVDGKDISGQSPAQVANVIRGKAGTKVALTIYRPKTESQLKIEVERQKIDLPNMEWKMLEDGIAHIRIYRFTEDSLAAFNANWDKLVTEVVKASPKGVVVDLRNNPGGYVDGVKYVAEEFLEEGKTIFMERTKGGDEKTAKVERKGRLVQMPITVLVNEGSASASEILAGALQDNKRAQILGAKTVGKGVEQKLIRNDDGSLLILVFRKWLTPAGRNLDAENPIAPDKLVAQDEVKAGDEQLKAAIDELIAR